MKSLSLFQKKKKSAVQSFFSTMLVISVVLQATSGMLLVPRLASATEVDSTQAQTSIESTGSNDQLLSVVSDITPESTVVDSGKLVEQESSSGGESDPVDNSNVGESVVSEREVRESPQSSSNGQESSQIDVLKTLAFSVNTIEQDEHKDTTKDEQTHTNDLKTTSTVIGGNVSLHQGENINSNSCPVGTDAGGITLKNGEMVWHFVLVGSNTSKPATLYATWNGTSVSAMAPSKITSGVQHYYVKTSQPEMLLNAMVKNAVASKHGKLMLNLSHCTKTTDYVETGSIKVCKAIKVDWAVKTSNTNLPFGKFYVGLKKNSNSVGTIAWETTTFQANSDVLTQHPGIDAECKSIENLPFGTYSFQKEVVMGDNWDTPEYALGNSIAYSDLRFYCDQSQTSSCMSGEITISQSKPTATVVVLNKYTTPVVEVNQKPVISVTGLNPAEITQGSTYVDKGATASDPEDGNITSNIVVTGSVNTTIVGTYTITYNVKDSKGLAADTKTRTVKVVTVNACRAALDVAMVIDRSGSMNDDGTNPEQPLTQAKDAAKGFIDSLSQTSDRVAIVSFSSTASLNKAFTSDFGAAKGSLTFKAGSGTNIGDGLLKATSELNTNARNGAKKAIILLSDGKPNHPTSQTIATTYALSQATAAKDKGYVVYSIGLGSQIDSTLMKQIASSHSTYFYAPSGADLNRIYQQISAIECEREPATVAGRVIDDKNGNGSTDVGDIGVQGRTVTVTSVSATTPFRTVTTNSSGDYSVADIPEGTYLVCTTLPADWKITFPDTINGCHQVTLTSGQTIANKNFLTTYAPNPACSDGKDNDGDGKVDFPEDTGCDNATDNDENNKPVITVGTPNPLQVLLGSTLGTLVVSALDQEDGNITANIVTTGSVDTNTVGSYTITYNVSDSKGLAADTKTRTVNVVTQCSDGVDNDGDGKADLLDSGCDSATDNDENNIPVITVIAPNPTEVLKGSVFTDLGATAFDEEDKDITGNIVTTGAVDTNTVGSYTITYNVSDSKGLAAVEKTRTVKVVSQCSDGINNDADSAIDFPEDLGCSNPNDNDENNKPVITLLGDATITITVGSVFTDPSATALDLEDGVITDKIVVAGSVNTGVIGSYTITYNVSDSKGLAADTVTRTVNVVAAGCTSNCGGGGGGSTPPACADGADNDSDGFADFPRDPGCTSSIDNDERDGGPTIVLKGSNPDTVTQGTTYADPGATATDPEDGDITAKIVASSTVNTATVGSYTIIYSVQDKDGNQASPVTRTVNVVAVGCTSNCGGGGGGSVSLTISNEKITVTADQAVITWSTNLPADSRVVYGLDPRTTLGSAPLYGYSSTNATNATLTYEHSMAITGLIQGVTYYFRPVSSDNRTTVVGVELKREQVATSCEYLKEYMRYSVVNNPSEVVKLQQFLKDFEGNSSLSVSGFFDLSTDAAVRAFQDKYAADVLTPWNLPSNTGYVYYTTQKKINEIYCKRAFPLNSDQLREIASYKLLLEQLSTQPAGSIVTLPIVGSNSSGSGISANVTENGSVAGASTENVTTENPKTDKEAVVSNKGKIALADLLAISPNLTGAFKKGEKSGEGEVMSTNTERTSGGILAGVADSFNLDNCSLSAWMLFVLILILMMMYIRLWMKYRKDKEMSI